MPKILVTGGAGFSGSHLCDYIIDQTDWDLVVWDALTYAGKMENLSRITDDPDRKKRFEFVQLDFSRHIDDRFLKQYESIDFICHLGAETHVKNSLQNPHPFIFSNVVGTYNMLEVARKLKPKKFLYVSTDEVFGASIFPRKEGDELRPSNPYSASKAAGEMLCCAYSDSFQIPLLISRSSNLYGSRQHEEKMVPMTIKKLRNKETVEIHTGPNGEVGSRQWLHTSDQSSAILFLLQSDQTGVFHIAGERKTNQEVVATIARAMGPEYSFETCRMINAFDLYKGHDLNYNIDDSKLRALGWSPKMKFEWGIQQIV